MRPVISKALGTEASAGSGSGAEPSPAQPASANSPQARRTRVLRA
ncbi:hypothetical protein [Usitatibacter rugosus]|nr:hypothetical protein [Usitatibacter rugosus]